MTCNGTFAWKTGNCHQVRKCFLFYRLRCQLNDTKQDADRMERELEEKVEDLEEELAAAGREVAALKSQLAQRDQRVRELEEELRGRLRPMMTSLLQTKA